LRVEGFWVDGVSVDGVWVEGLRVEGLRVEEYTDSQIFCNRVALNYLVCAQNRIYLLLETLVAIAN
jgi:hypothetical protein